MEGEEGLDARSNGTKMGCMLAELGRGWHYHGAEE